MIQNANKYIINITLHYPIDDRIVCNMHENNINVEGYDVSRKECP